MRTLLIRLVLLAVVAGVGYGGWFAYKQLPGRQEQTPTQKVRRGDVIVRSYARGELRAVRSSTLIAPNLFGTVQITRMAPVGALAREKDLVVEFDDSEVNSRLEEKQLEIDQIDERLKKARADLAIRNNQDQVELLRARYAVRRAELEVKRNELLSAIDARKNELNQEEARRRLTQLESDIKSRQEQAQAELAVLNEQKNKGLMELGRERQRLSQVKLLAPMGGLVAVKQNRNGMFFFGQQIPDIREGDQVQPGTPVADVLDLSELEVVAKVGELDRANLREGQDVTIALDAIPNRRFNGKIKTMSGAASANFFSADPQKKFDVTFSIDMKELLSALGAKPDQVQKILSQAEANRKKPPVPSGPPPGMGGPGGGPVMASMGGPGGGASPAGQAPGGGGAGGPGGPGAGGNRVMIAAGPGGAGSGASPEQQGRMREALTKALSGKRMEDLKPEERQEIMAKVRGEMAKAGGGQAGRLGGGAGGSGGPPIMMARMGGPGGQFSTADLDRAQLPPSPEQDSQLDVLLRPGLLVDVEIIVDKVPNAVHVPLQAVFEKDGKPTVWVKNGERFDQRVIKPLKRSESVLVVADGLREGETIAMADPTARKDDKAGKPAAGGAMGSLPGAKGGQ